MNIVIINPTYNENENIKILVKEIGKVIHELEENNKSDTVIQLVVDDSSPDGTGETVKTLMKDSSYSFLRIIEGNKEGLGKAYVRGMKYAIESLHADVVIEMDADLQHDPKLIKTLIKYIYDGYDFVIASRYVSGGAYEKTWSKFRVLNSKIANIVSRGIAGLKTHDTTSGFRAIRSTILNKIDLENITSDGYAFQFELLYLAEKKHAKIKEFGFLFKDRKFGQSKISLNKQYILDILNFFFLAFKFRYLNSIKILKFGVVGLTGTIINLIIYHLVIKDVKIAFIAEAIGYELSLFFNFGFNHYWTFKSNEKPLKALIKYNGTSLISLIVTSTVTQITSLLFSKYKTNFLIPIPGIGVGFIVNYVLAKKFVWRQK